MDIERALETQRHALLRLLAGLFMAVGFVSQGPFKHSLPRWAEALVLYVLCCAEEAAHCLVKVSAWMLIGQGVTVSAATQPKRPKHPQNDVDMRNTTSTRERETGADDTSVSERLRQRMQAVMDMLEDLPGHALRLMRRRALEAAGQQKRPAPIGFGRGALSTCGLFSAHQVPVPEIKRPPI